MINIIENAYEKERREYEKEQRDNERKQHSNNIQLCLNVLKTNHKTGKKTKHINIIFFNDAYHYKQDYLKARNDVIYYLKNDIKKSGNNFVIFQIGKNIDNITPILQVNDYVITAIDFLLLKSNEYPENQYIQDFDINSCIKENKQFGFLSKYKGATVFYITVNGVKIFNL